MFKQVKVLDSTEVPGEVREFILDYWECNNDSAFYYTLGDSSEHWDEETNTFIVRESILDKFLREGGLQENETILLHTWW
jgi:hypothetical protein